jgi:hypothetical protein
MHARKEIMQYLEKYGYCMPTIASRPADDLVLLSLRLAAKFISWTAIKNMFSGVCGLFLSY